MLASIESVVHHKQFLWSMGLYILVGGGVWLCRKHWVIASLVGFIVLVLGMMIIPSSIGARDAAEGSSCINDLREIDGAKIRWAADHHKEKTDAPTDADLFGEGFYMKSKPECPSGGVYILGKMNENPKCSLGDAKGHKLDEPN